MDSPDCPDIITANKGYDKLMLTSITQKTKLISTIMKEEILKLFWEMSKSTYPAGNSNHTNAILERDFETLIEKIILVKSKKYLSENAPECSNCHNQMKLHGIAYECRCGIVSVV